MIEVAIIAIVFAVIIAGTCYRVGFYRGHDAGCQVGRDIQRVADIEEQWRKESVRRGKDGRFVAIKGKAGA